MSIDEELVVETNNLSKKYKQLNAVDNVSIKIHKGDIYGFIGRNGAGKTTLIRLLTGVATPTSGDYSLFGVSYRENPKELEKMRKKVAAMVETPALYLDLTAKENLKTRCILLGIKNDKEVINNRLEEVGLSEIINSKKKVKDFSLGMRQRLGIAMSILGNPELLILDEPTNGLDPEGIREMRDLLIKINKEMGITMIVSSHILSELGKFATTYGFIDHGRLIKEASAEEIFKMSKKAILLEVDDNGKAIKLLKETIPDLEYELDGNHLRLTNIENVADALAILYKSDLKIKSVREEENGLENYFLGLIGGQING